ncbi:hypothetical protein MSAN_00114800 [Mycena sanguinolenta]|uniref:Uncharacterized protein n=1 Tax=Mycena sanguinolenta TaxID=230812 RepID=A0A8H6ZK53_9AGAR|nr:hypothetical protein MSAN_00114800 [Mycena sanguinolenta]
MPSAAEPSRRATRRHATARMSTGGRPPRIPVQLPFSGPDSAFHEIRCGADVTRRYMDTPSPYPRLAVPRHVPSMLPLSLNMRPVHPEVSSTGCGTKIHHRATPGHRVWLLTSATTLPTVVPLSAEYFTEAQKRDLHGVPRMSECGCTAIGVGCCVCGNALGIYRTHCSTHSQPASYTFLPGSVSPPLPPRQWRFHARPTPPAIEAIATTTSTSEPRVESRLSTLFDSWMRDSSQRWEPPPPPTDEELRDMAEQAEAEFEAEEARRAEATARFDAVHGLSRGVNMPRTISEVNTWLAVHSSDESRDQPEHDDGSVAAVSRFNR